MRELIPGYFYLSVHFFPLLYLLSYGQRKKVLWHFKILLVLNLLSHLGRTLVTVGRILCLLSVASPWVSGTKPQFLLM